MNFYFSDTIGKVMLPIKVLNQSEDFMLFQINVFHLNKLMFLI